MSPELERRNAFAEHSPPCKISAWRLREIVEDTIRFSFCGPCEHFQRLGNPMVYEVSLTSDKSSKHWAYDLNERWFGEDDVRFAFAARHACYLWEVSQESIQQKLGKALGYMRYCDDQVNFPGSTTDDGVFVGEHVAETLAMEAANRLECLREVNLQLAIEREDLMAYVCYLHVCIKRACSPVSFEAFAEREQP
jgi:hypothetical protein